MFDEAAGANPTNACMWGEESRVSDNAISLLFVCHVVAKIVMICQ